MTWTSARIGWTAVVLWFGFFLVVRASSGLGPVRHDVWWTLALMAIGLATGVLPSGACKLLQRQPRDPWYGRTARRLTLIVLAVLFVASIAIIQTSRSSHRPGIRPSERATAGLAFEVAVLSGLALIWVVMGATPTGAVVAMTVVLGGFAALSFWNPDWPRALFLARAGPYLAGHRILGALLFALPVLVLMISSADDRVAAILRLMPVLTLTFVAGTMIFSTGQFYLKVFRMSQSVSGHR